jgi:hypothetical protein
MQNALVLAVGSLKQVLNLYISRKKKYAILQCILYLLQYWSTGNHPKNLKYYLSRTIVLIHLIPNACEGCKMIL